MTLIKRPNLIKAYLATQAIALAEYNSAHYVGLSSVSKAARKTKAGQPKPAAPAAKSKKKSSKGRKIGRSARKAANKAARLPKAADVIAAVATAATAAVPLLPIMSASAIGLVGGQIAKANADLKGWASPADKNYKPKTESSVAKTTSGSGSASFPISGVERKAPAPRGAVTFRAGVPYTSYTATAGRIFPHCHIPKVRSPFAGVGFGVKAAKAIASVVVQAATAAKAIFGGAVAAAASKVSDFLAQARSIRAAAESVWKPLAGFVMQLDPQSQAGAGDSQSANSGGTTAGARVSHPGETMNTKVLAQEYNLRAAPDYPMMQRTSRSLSDVLAIGDPVGEVYGQGVVTRPIDPRSMAYTQYGVLKLFCQLALRGQVKFPVATDRPIGWFNHHWTQEDLVHVCTQVGRLASNLGKSFIQVITTGANARVTFDPKGQRFIDINERGVFISDRQLEVTPLLLVAEEATEAKHLCFLNSYGVVAFYILTSGMKYLFQSNSKGRGLYVEAERFYDDVLLGKRDNQFPVTNENEVGALDGDRVSYTRYATQVRFFDPAVLSHVFPLGFVKDPEGLVARFKVTFQPLAWTPKMSLERKAHEYESLIFEAFNLVNKKEAFIDGRKVCLRVRDIPEAMQARFIRGAGRVNLGTEDVAEIAKISGWVTADGCPETWLRRNLVLTLSNKVSKLVKRCVMDSALVGEIEGGVGRAFQVFGQEMSENNALIPACISQTLVSAAGTALHWGAKPVLLNQHTSRRQPGFRPVLDANGVPDIQWVYGPNSVTVEGGMHVAHWDKDTVCVSAGDVVAQVPYHTLEGGIGYVDITADMDGSFLSKLTYGMQRVAGAHEDLVIKYQTYTREQSLKARNYVKAMMTHYHDRTFNCGLNGDAYAEALFTRDTNKWSDLVMSNVDVAAATFVHNQSHEKCSRGFELLRKANALLGSTETDRLVYHPMLALAGAYKELIAEFESVFGRAVWLRWSCGKEGAWAKHLNAQYIDQATGNCVDGWVKFTPEAVRSQQVVFAIAQTDSVESIDEKTNLLCVVLDQGEYWVIQRGWSFVGTEDCPVIQPIKAELASVNSALSTTRVMAGVARSAWAQNPELGMAMLEDGLKNIQLSAAHIALSQGAGLRNEATGEDIRQVYLIDEEEDATWMARVKQAVLEEIAGVTDPSNLLKAFAKRFKNVIFTFRRTTRTGMTEKQLHFSVWFPALFAQDASADYRTQDSLGALIRNLFVYLAQTEFPDRAEVDLLLSRIQSSYAKIAGSDGMIKSTSFGRRAAQGKPVGIPEVPVGEIWVKSAGHGRSLCDVLAQVNLRDGSQAIMARAPMTEAAFLSVVTIYRSHWAYDFMADDVPYLNSLVSVVHGGDYDGDSNCFVPADDVEMPKMDLAGLHKLVLLRTGSDQLAHTNADGSVSFGGLYYSDHFEIKSLAQIAKKAGVQKANFVSLKALGGLLERSSRTLGEMVGILHSITLFTDLLNTYKTGENGSYAGLDLIRILYEMYEVPLGGLDEVLYSLCYEGDDALLGEKQVDVRDTGRIERYRKMMGEAGMNGAEAARIAFAARQALGTSKMMRNGKKLAGVLATEGVAILPRVAAYAAVRMSKGQFRPNAGGPDRIILEYLHQHFKDDVRSNPVAWSVGQFLAYTAKALMGQTVTVSVELFSDPDSGNSGGGGEPSPVPSGPSSPEETKMEESSVEFVNLEPSLLDEAYAWRSRLPQSLLCLGEWSSLSPDQLVAVWRICRTDAADCVTLTGRAGAGKSFVVELCRKVLQGLQVEVVVVGSTGVATTNVSGEATLNALVGLGIGDVLPAGVSEYGERGRRRRRPMSQCVRKVQQRLAKGHGPVRVFIEEVSMCSSETLVLAYQAISQACGLLHRDVKFVCVGDLRQLKVVDKADDEANWTEYRSVPFDRAKFSINRKDGADLLTFGSLLSEQGPFQLCQGLSASDWRAERISLLTNHRQKSNDPEGAAFLDALNALGDGASFEDTRLFPISERIFVPEGDGYTSILTGEHIAFTDLEESLHVFFTNKQVDSHNHQRLEKLKASGAPNRTYTADIRPGEWSREQILREMQPVREHTLLCEGMRFMVRVNTEVDDVRLANGTMGTVTKVYPNSFDLTLPDGQTVRVGKTNYPMPVASNGSPAGTVSTVAIGHAAYGSTAWKTQGITVKEVPGFPQGFGRVAVHVDYAKMEHGLLYTVCSRVQCASQLVILAPNPSAVAQMAFAEEGMRGFIQESEAAMQSYLSSKSVAYATEVRVVDGVEKKATHLYYEGRRFLVNQQGKAFFYEGGWKPVNSPELTAALAGN